MRILLVHNEYAALSGEEVMLRRIALLLSRHGHEVQWLRRSSTEIGNSLVRKAGAFLSGIYSPAARNEMKRILDRSQPDLVQVQNLYPLISASILGEIRRRGIPLVMRCANYRLLCPNGLLMTRGRVCHRCAEGGEWWCVAKNCLGQPAKSLGYALRNYAARRRGWFRDNVSLYIAQTRFQKELLSKYGYEPAKIMVVANMVEPAPAAEGIGEYVGFAGRVSPEKGIDTLLAAARQLRSIPFRIAGSLHAMPGVLSDLPPNVEFCGHLGHAELGRFYDNARFIVLPSTCYEGLPSTVLSAMVRGRAVVASNLGGIPEVVRHGQTGLLFGPGDSVDLTRTIDALWNDQALCRQLGNAARETALTEYSPGRYYDELMGAYGMACGIGRETAEEPATSGFVPM